MAHTIFEKNQQQKICVFVLFLFVELFKTSSVSRAFFVCFFSFLSLFFSSFKRKTGKQFQYSRPVKQILFPANDFVPVAADVVIKSEELACHTSDTESTAHNQRLFNSLLSVATNGKPTNVLLQTPRTHTHTLKNPRLGQRQARRRRRRVRVGVRAKRDKLESRAVPAP